MFWTQSIQKSKPSTKTSKPLEESTILQSVKREIPFPHILDEVYIDMFYTTDTFFALRTISLLSGDILVFKSLPISDKTARYVPSQEKAIAHTLSLFSANRTHKQMYLTDDKGFVEAVYRRQY